MATGSKLVIVESPTKARKIGGYLGSDYTVMASVGHIRDLARPSQVPSADKAKFGHRVALGADLETRGAGQAHGVPRDHAGGDQGIAE